MMIVKCWLFDTSFYNKAWMLLMPWRRVSCICKTACFLANYAPHSLQPGRKGGAVRLQVGIVHWTEQTVWDKIQTQAMDCGLSQSEAFPPLSPEHSDVARECDIMLPIKGDCVCALEALRLDIWLWTLGLYLGDQCSVVDRKVGLSLRDIAATSMVRTPLRFIICLACSGLIACALPQPLGWGDL